MKIKYRVLLLVASFVVLSNVTAQSPLTYLGKGLNSLEVVNYTSKLERNETIESFLPFQKTYKLDYLSSGATLEYNSDMGLYRISMYDSGYTYNQYALELPYGLSWGMTESQIEAKIGNLEENRENPFKKLYTTDNDITEFYFLDGQISVIKVTATTQKLKEHYISVYRGWGVRLLPDGQYVSGDVVSGNGIMKWGKDIAIYEGEWSYGLPHGKGEYIDSFGNKYSGEFKLGFFWGEGAYYSKTKGYSYTGNYVMGKRHGKGKVTYVNKSGYDGGWFQDLMQGKGVYVMGTSYYYEGEMVNNNFNGKGYLKTPDGSITGSFKDGKPHGYCEQVSEDKTQAMKGNWVNGRKEGSFTLYAFGTEKKMYFENDIEIIEGLEKGKN
ncbi:MAG: hypothetical protein KJP21_00995 [Bacteroidia bacterium]|nr:hypothetical protein [Bacteroidia bacterium]NNJ55109.1 hypothetical protein [Bacteroidia bacterium]